MLPRSQCTNKQVRSGPHKTSSWPSSSPSANTTDLACNCQGMVGWGGGGSWAARRAKQDTFQSNRAPNEFMPRAGDGHDCRKHHAYTAAKMERGEDGHDYIRHPTMASRNLRLEPACRGSHRWATRAPPRQSITRPLHLPHHRPQRDPNDLRLGLPGTCPKPSSGRGRMCHTKAHTGGSSDAMATRPPPPFKTLRSTPTMSARSSLAGTSTRSSPLRSGRGRR